MLWTALIVYLLYIGYLLGEKAQLNACRAKIKVVIHVNGTRGKTDVCRRIDKGLRNLGYRVMTKTTGTVPCIIDTGGREEVIRRRSPVNIREKIAVIRRAAKEKADVLILECMAVNPVLQRVCEEKIIRSDIGVITNVRYDHVFEMGFELEQIAQALSATIPQGGVLFTGEEQFLSVFQQNGKELGTAIYLCLPSREDHAAGNAAMGAIAANAALAEGVLRHISKKRTAAHGIDYGQEFGTAALYSIIDKNKKAIRFLNLLSVNDPQSTLALLQEHRKSFQENGPNEAVVYLYNNRADRPDRTLLFAQYFFPYAQTGEVFIVGENRRLACRIFKKGGVKKVTALSDWRQVFEVGNGRTVVGLGNIKGPGTEIIRCLEGGGL